MLPDCLLFFVWIFPVGIASVGAAADKRKKANLTVYPRRKFLAMIDDSSAGNVEM